MFYALNLEIIFASVVAVLKTYTKGYMLYVVQSKWFTICMGLISISHCRSGANYEVLCLKTNAVKSMKHDS